MRPGPNWSAGTMRAYTQNDATDAMIGEATMIATVPE